MYEPGTYDLEWAELDSRIYTGEKDGYTESVHLDPNTEPRAGSVKCQSFQRGANEWMFVFEGGHICLVDNNRVRYVKGRAHSAIKRETQSDDVMAIEDGLKNGEENIHANISMPKRRGRPPKVRSE